MSVSLKELAHGYILCRDNSKRLIDDATILHQNKSYLSSISNCRLANEEIGKAIIIWNASIFSVNDEDKWKWFESSIFNHIEKIRVLEYSLHWESYKDKDRFDFIVANLKDSREQSIYVGFDKTKNVFEEPENCFKVLPEAARIELLYSQKIHEFVFLADYISGISSEEDIEEAFKIGIKKKDITIASTGQRPLS